MFSKKVSAKDKIKRQFMTAQELCEFGSEYVSASRILGLCHNAALKGCSYIELTFPIINVKSVELLNEMGYKIHKIHSPYLNERYERTVYYHVIFNMEEYLKHNKDKHELNLL